jgi:DNA-binding response OmpR family regulator
LPTKCVPSRSGALGDVLILAREEVVAALLGLMVEVSGFQPRFPGDDESVVDAIAKKRPYAVLIDCDHPEFSEDLIDLVRRSGSRPILFSPFRNQPEMTRLATRHGAQSFTLPTEPDSFSGLLNG